MENDPIICFDCQSCGGVDLSWIGLVRAGDLLTIRYSCFQKGFVHSVDHDNYQFRVYRGVSKKILRQVNSRYFSNIDQLTPFIVSELDIPTSDFNADRPEDYFFVELFLLGMITFASETALMSLGYREDNNSSVSYYFLNKPFL
jgi:hypothetical protein